MTCSRQQRKAPRLRIEPGTSGTGVNQSTPAPFRTLNKITRLRWRICDVAHKHSCPPRMIPMENILKCKHLFMSRVRIVMILLLFKLLIFD